MVKTGGTSEFDDQIRKVFGRINYLLENPLPFSERTKFYIDHANLRLEIVQDEQAQGDQPISEWETSKREAKYAQAQGDLRALIREGNKALEFFTANDLDRALQAYDRMHEYRAKCNLPLYESAAQSKRAQGKTGKYGPVRKILTWLDMNYPENSDIFECWRKTREIIETGNGEKWSLESGRIMWTEDSGGSVKPEDYEYFYADRSDEGAQLNLIPVTVGNIRTTLSGIREDN